MPYQPYDDITSSVASDSTDSNHTVVVSKSTLSCYFSIWCTRIGFISGVSATFRSAIKHSFIN